MIKTYYELAKPGIIYGNALAAVAGFFFASRGLPLDWPLLVATVFGLACIIGSACVFNNVYDYEMDAKMERTKHRPSATGEISRRNATIFGFVLGFFGFSFLILYSSTMALFSALLGFFIYVFLYTPLKPKSAWALFVGAAAGATPPVVGYAAVTGMLDWYALALFGALYLWQLPHFLAIATYRYTEYAVAGVPLFITKEPSSRTKRRAKIVFYSSLVVLLLFCVVLILQRWVR